MSRSRTENTIHNMYGALLYQAVVAILSFIVRRVFLKHIVVYFLGLDGLFSNLINMLCLLDFGVGAASVYYLARAFATHDKDKINTVYHAFVRLYRIVGIIIAIVGFLFSFHLGFFVDTHGYSEEYIRFVFYVTLARTVAFYFFSCPKNVFLCAQQNYINSNINTICSILFALIKIVVIIHTQSYNDYLFVLLAEVLAGYLLTYIEFYRLYPRKKPVEKEVRKEMSQILSYGRRMILLSINNFIFNSTDNLVISHYLGVTIVGYMNNYYMIVNAVILIVTQVIESASASIYSYVNEPGNNNPEHLQKLFMEMSFICFAVGLFAAVCLFGLTDQFISLFYGIEFMMSKTVITCFVVNLMITVMMYPMIYYEEGRGLKPKENIAAFLSAAGNVSLSIWLVHYFQATGVLIGTILSNLILFFGRYFIVFHTLHMDGWKYFRNLISYAAAFGIDLLIVFKVLPRYATSLIQWILFALFCFLIVGITVLCFFRSEGFQRMKEIITSAMHIRKSEN